MLTQQLKLLIAYDGTACADAALDDLRRAGLPDEVEALVVFVEESSRLPEVASYEVVDGVLCEISAHPEMVSAHSHSLSLATIGAERIRKSFPLWKVRAESVKGSAARAILGRAEEWPPDLITVGSHGRSALGRVVLGSVSQKVLRNAQTSVRVARRSEAGRQSIRIVIGVDGSLSSLAAVREVARRIWPPHSEVLVLAVEDPLVPTAVGSLIPPLTNRVKEQNPSEGEWLKKVLDNSVADLRAAGMTASVSVVTGDPKHVLVDEAKRFKADTIFVGSVGFSNRVERLLLGSVSAAVSARSHCTVEVVRPKKMNLIVPTPVG